MKAECITFSEPGKVEIGEIEIGSPSGGELLTKTRITGVSTGTETRVYRGKQEGSSFPLIPGYENLGEIVEVGPDVGFEVGRRVYVRKHNYDPGSYSRMWGSQVSHSLTTAESVVPVPDDVTDEQAIYAKVSGISLHGVKRAEVRENEWVVVVGLGIIGHLALQHAVARGAWAIGIDIDERRLQLARQAGALHAINGRERDTVQQVMSITEGGAHVAFDATGIASMLESTSKYLRPRPWDGDPAACSRLVLQGSLEDPVSVDYWALFMPELDLIVPRDCDTQDLVDSLSLMATGSIRPEIIPATTYSYRDAAEAYPRLVDREIMRVLFSWE